LVLEGDTLGGKEKEKKKNRREGEGEHKKRDRVPLEVSEVLRSLPTLPNLPTFKCVASSSQFLIQSINSS